MNSENLPLLYSFRRCPYAMRARLALSVSGQSCELREIDLKNRPEKLYQASSKGTVPVLVIEDGDVIEESLEIMRWSLNRRDPENWLSPFENHAKEAAAIIAACDGEFKFHLDRYKYAQRYEDVEPDEHRHQAAQFLEELNHKLSSSSFLYGSNVSMVDMAVLPFVRQFAFADMAWFQSQPWNQVLGWLGEFLDSARFQSIMTKHPIWTPDSQKTIQAW